MLSHRQNSPALRERWCADRGEAQSRERVKFIKKHPAQLFCHETDEIAFILSMTNPHAVQFPVPTN
jgi:hypothetical protein